MDRARHVFGESVEALLEYLLKLGELVLPGLRLVSLGTLVDVGDGAFEDADGGVGLALGACDAIGDAGDGFAEAAHRLARLLLNGVDAVEDFLRHGARAREVGFERALHAPGRVADGAFGLGLEQFEAGGGVCDARDASLDAALGRRHLLFDLVDAAGDAGGVRANGVVDGGVDRAGDVVDLVRDFADLLFEEVAKLFLVFFGEGEAFLHRAGEAVERGLECLETFERGRAAAFAFERVDAAAQGGLGRFDFAEGAGDALQRHELRLAGRVDLAHEAEDRLIHTRDGA